MDSPTPLAQKLFYLATGRALNTAYARMDDSQRQEMEAAFASGDPESWLPFLQSVIPDFAELFEQSLVAVAQDVGKEFGQVTINEN